MENNVVPFGKYKGKTIEEMLLDKNYVDWLSNQIWFKDKFFSIHQTIINYKSEDTPSPEHNEMQIKWLNNEYIENFVKKIGLVRENDLNFVFDTKFEIINDIDIHGGYERIHEHKHNNNLEKLNQFTKKNECVYAINQCNDLIVLYKKYIDVLHDIDFYDITTTYDEYNKLKKESSDVFKILVMEKYKIFTEYEDNIKTKFFSSMYIFEREIFDNFYENDHSDYYYNRINEALKKIEFNSESIKEKEKRLKEIDKNVSKLKNKFDLFEKEYGIYKSYVTKNNISYESGLLYFKIEKIKWGYIDYKSHIEMNEVCKTNLNKLILKDQIIITVESKNEIIKKIEEKIVEIQDYLTNPFTYTKSITLHIELKPVISDDYPAIFRKFVIKNRQQHGYMIVITKQFESQSVKLEQVKEFFDKGNIKFVLTSEYEETKKEK